MQFTAPYSVASCGRLALHFHPDHLADLRKSGLDDQTIKTAGVYSIRPYDIALFFSARRGLPTEINTGLCFPYQGGDFARLKLFLPLGKMKYAQPANTSARLYLPFDIAAGDLVLAEGEKKTLAAHQAGFNAVGIGGLWNWLTHGEPIDDLKLIGWDGRSCTIISDSDAFERPELMRAVYALGCDLRERGAIIYVARIPAPSSGKVGLDDYLVAGGTLDELEVFSIGSSNFKRVAAWHSGWKFKKALQAA
jgi:hypothetical protein